MITPDGKLEVFERFVIDRTLPKYRKLRDLVNKRSRDISKNEIYFYETGLIVDDNLQLDVHENMTPEQYEIENSIAVAESMLSQVISNSTFTAGRNEIIVSSRRDKSLFRSIWLFICSLFSKDASRQIEYTRHKISVFDFFKSMKASTKEIQVIKERSEGYRKALVQAKKSGQIALYEKLLVGLNTAGQEAKLVAIGLPKFLTEQVVVDFTKKTTKGIRLDWIKNFSRTIPSELIDKKIKCDDMGIFDNYLVMHYDPDVKSYTETQKEKEARKDPILFGVVSGQRVLYYIGDWIDEICDLTLDQIADLVGRQAISTTK